MIRTEMATGKLFYKLEEEIDYTNAGKEDKVRTLVLHEPVKDSAVECIKLSAMIQKSSGASMRAFFGDDVINKKKDVEEDVVGEEVVPFFKRENVSEEEVVKEVLKEADGISHIVLMSENIDQILKAGRELLTRPRSSNRTNCLAKIEDEKGTKLTDTLFRDLNINDQVFIICLYYCFFGLSSIGQRKTTSSKVQD